MNPQFYAAINQICDEKNIPRDKVIQTIKAALVTAYRKDFGNKEQEIEVEFDEKKGIATVLLIKEVVEEVENSNYEISLDEAKKIKKNVKIGDEVKIDVTPLEYGRIAAQAAKQVILQRIQEAERESLFEMFKNREEEVLNALVTRIEGQNVFLEIEKDTVILPFKEQIPGEHYTPGRRIRVFLDRVTQTTKGPQLIISRINPKLVEKLLTMEIPEIKSGEVKIMSIARDAGFRTKVAVKSTDAKIDPIGACVGQKGVRIQNIMEELNGERVDMIQWYKEPEKFIATALQPAKITAVIVVNDEDFVDERGRNIRKRAAVFVEEEERAMAIGKKGQNVRLASELTGYELDMYNVSELPAFQKKLEELTGEKIEVKLDQLADIKVKRPRKKEEKKGKDKDGGEEISDKSQAVEEEEKKRR